MQLRIKYHCDVLVVGAGLAGIMAAIKAAEKGQRVILISSGKICSGSSFYPGTWGLGLIAPEDEADEQDLAAQIQTVGCGMADEAMVTSFVKGIRPAIRTLQAMGVSMKQAVDGTQKEFIPCFDHKHRKWYGLLSASMQKVLPGALQEKQVELMPYCDLVELMQAGQKVCGAVIREQTNELSAINCKAVILATGGYGSIFKHFLTTQDVGGYGQYLALEAGCELINLEFMQMIPGYLRPCYKTIFNERTFRYARLQDEAGQNILDGLQDQEKLLALRSSYAPFTTRLASKQIDFAMERAIAAKRLEGVHISYEQRLSADMPEFIRTYFDWLAREKGLGPADEIVIAQFAHAANGGIRIRPDASTEVAGLYACGEVTGGMHGADRIGGLSTANGLVFGLQAGSSAADYAAAKSLEEEVFLAREYWCIHEREAAKEKLQQIMSAASMVVRSESGLRHAHAQLQQLLRQAKKTPAEDAAAIRDSRLLWGQLQLAVCIVEAQLMRKESRGSHYREDFPEEKEQLNRPIVIKRQQDRSVLHFQAMNQRPD